MPPFADETDYVQDIAMLGQSNRIGYPILSLLIGRAGLFFADWNQLRWVPFLISLGVLALTALLAKQVLGRRAALWSALVLAVAPLNVHASTQFIYDGSFTAFFALAFAYGYWQCVREGGWRWPAAAGCGACLGCLWLTTYGAFVIAAGLALHCWLTRGWKTTFQVFAVVGAIAVAIYAPYTMLSPFHHGLALQKALGAFSWSAIQAKTSIPLSLYGRSWSKALILVGPLLLWGLLRTLASAEQRRRLSLPLCVCLVYMATYLLLLPPDRTLGYWSAILPFWCIIAGQAANDILGETPPSRLIVPAAGFIAALALLTRAGPHEIQPVLPSIHWTWKGLLEFMPIRTSHGPSLAFYFKPAAILIGFVGVLALGVAARLKPKLSRYLLGLGLAYGLFCSVEYSYALYSPNLNRVGERVADRLQEGHFPQPLYVHGYSASACQQRHLLVHSFLYDAPIMGRLTRLMEKTGGTVVLLNVSAIRSDAELRRFLDTRAKLQESFYDKGALLAQIWTVPRATPSGKKRS